MVHARTIRYGVEGFSRGFELKIQNDLRGATWGQKPSAPFYLERKKTL